MFNCNKMQLVLVVALVCVGLSAVETEAFELWNTGTVKDFFKSNTKIVGDFIQRQKKGIVEFIDEKTTKYIERAKDVGDDVMGVLKPDCNYNPDVDLNTPQIISRHGYPAESHTVQTEDGYILTLHRIPRGKNRTNGTGQPVFLQHGLLASSTDWIMSGPEKGLAYLLADAGYDVWMGNVRGNTYSRAHVKLSHKDYAFWNFSWHEIAIYDISACIDYVNNLTNSDKELIYVGHSMGTTVLFTLLSMKPEYNEKIRAGFALAPEVYLTGVRSPIKLLAPFVNNIELISKYFGAGEFLPQSYILRWLARFGCEFNHIEEKICENSIFILCGFDEKEFNKTLMPMILSHTPAGASTKSIIHYAQEIHNKGKFQMYDYGVKENKIRYGTKTPPEYQMDNLTLPIALFSARNDWLSSVADGKALYKKLKNPIEMYEIEMDEFNHLDFLWGIDAPKLVYKKLMELMGNYRTVSKMSWYIRPDAFKFSWEGNVQK